MQSIPTRYKAGSGLWRLLLALGLVLAMLVPQASAGASPRAVSLSPEQGPAPSPVTARGDDKRGPRAPRPSSFTTAQSPIPIPAIAWGTNDASIPISGDDNLEFDLPFTFPFFGRQITRLGVNTNGLVELLEAGESCVECDDYETHADGDHVTGQIDALFAANDDLITGVLIEGDTGGCRSPGPGRRSTTTISTACLSPSR